MVFEGTSVGLCFVDDKLLKHRKEILKIDKLFQALESDTDFNFVTINYCDDLKGNTIKIITNKIETFASDEVIESDFSNAVKIAKNLISKWKER